MLYNLDVAVGRLMDALAATVDPMIPGATLADTTLVVFSSDNGGEGSYAEQGIVLLDRDNTDNAPLTGGKGTLFEGGLRVPLLVAHPGLAARVVSTPVSLADVAPTVLASVGLGVPDDLDGKNLLPLLAGESAAFERQTVLHHFPAYLEAEHGTWRAVPTTVARDEQYKLWYNWETRTLSLFDLAVDPGERTDVSKTHLDVQDRLLGEMVSWLTTTGAALPRDPLTGAEEPLPVGP